MSKSYNKVSQLQLESNLKNKPHLLSYLLEAAKLFPTQLNIADFGCSTGRNSFIIFREVLSEFRQKFDIPVTISHEDQPTNAWEEYFKAYDELGYHDIPEVYSFIVGKSFYQQVFPNNYLHLAYCNSALHYAKRNIACPDHTNPFLSSNPDIRETAIQYGRADLKELLELRARELAPGGFFIINCLFQGQKLKDFFNIRNEFNKLMVQEGFLKEEEYERLQTPIYPYSLEDWNQVLHELSYLYRIRHFEIHERVNVIYEKFLEDSDVDKYAEQMTGFIRGVFESSLRSCLLREESEKESVIEGYFNRHIEHLKKQQWELGGTRILVILEIIKSN